MQLNLPFILKKSFTADWLLYCNNGIKVRGQLIETSVLWLYWFASFKSKNGILHTIFVMQKVFWTNHQSLSCKGKSKYTLFQFIFIKMWFIATWCFLELFFCGNSAYTLLVLPQTLCLLQKGSMWKLLFYSETLTHLKYKWNHIPCGVVASQTNVQ